MGRDGGVDVGLDGPAVPLGVAQGVAGADPLDWHASLSRVRIVEREEAELVAGPVAQAESPCRPRRRR